MNLLLALLLLLSANGAPIVLQRMLGNRWAFPLDGGVHFVDGKPLLGKAKTVRGIIAALFVCTLIGLVGGIEVMTGLLFGFFAMLGDLISSFVKRRLGIPPSGQALLLDQLPESFLPLWVLQEPLGLVEWQVVMISLLFVVVELLLSRLLYRWHIRNEPY